MDKSVYSVPYTTLATKTTYNPQIIPPVSRSSSTKVIVDKNHERHDSMKDKSMKSGTFVDVAVNPYQRNSNVLVGNMPNQVKAPDTTVIIGKPVSRPRTAVSRPKTAQTHISSTLATTMAKDNEYSASNRMPEPSTPYAPPALNLLDMSRMYWLEEQVDLLRCKAEERDRTVNQLLNVKLVLNEQEDAIRHLKSENSELQNYVKMLLRSRDTDISAQSEDIEKKYNTHQTRQTEDNRELSKQHIIDQDKQGNLEDMVSERGNEIDQLKDILHKKDVEVRRQHQQEEMFQDRMQELTSRLERVEMEHKQLQKSDAELKTQYTIQKEHVKSQTVEIELGKGLVAQNQQQIQSQQTEISIVREEKLDCEKSMRESWQRCTAIEEQAKQQIEGQREAVSKAEMAKKERNYIEHKLTQEQAKSQDLDEQIKKIKAQMVKLETSREKYKDTNEFLVAQSSAATVEIEKLHQNNDLVARENATLATEVKYQKSQLEEETKNNDTSARMLERYKEMYYETRSQSNALEQKTIELQKLVEKHESFIESAKEMRADSQNVINIANLKVAEADNHVKEQKSAKTLLEHDAESRIRELRAITKQYLALHSEYSSVNAELGAVKTQVAMQQEQLQKK